MVISAQDKIRAVKAVVESKKSISEVAARFDISRRSLFRWVRCYQSSPRRLQTSCLVAKYVRGVKHPRAVQPKAYEAVRRLIVSHPEWGVRKISSELSRTGFGLGASGVYDQLIGLGANTPGLRKVFVKSWSGPGRISSEIKLEIVRSVLDEKRGMAEVCQKYRVSRRSLYNWINRYHSKSNYGVSGTAIFDDAYVSAEAHPRSVSPEIETRLLSLVAAHPAFSVHKLKEQLPVSIWTVQKLLARNHLNLYEQRVKFAQEQSEIEEARPVVSQFIDRVKSVFEAFMPNLAPAPPPIVSLLKLVKKVAFVSAVLILIFFSVGWWTRLAESYTLPQIVGLSFAAIALSSGMLFFLYSLKYYFTIALVLSYSQTGAVGTRDRFVGRKGLLSWVLGLSEGKEDGRRMGPVGLEPNLDKVKLTKTPMVCIQIPFYNEKNVAERAVVAACNLDYPNYEVIIADDSTDATTSIIRKYQEKFGKVTELSGDGWTMATVEIRRGMVLKHLHRTTRSGFKGAALNLALKHTDPKVEFISIFDADFVPFPDSIRLFLKYFKLQNNMSENYEKSKVAAVQGYQWHVLNKSENWITRGVRTEYSGSYVIERAGTELYGGLKMISGSVYMIRRKPLEEAGWGTSITEDFELTLKLYNLGYKVVYTPYIQAPAECVSTLKRLVKQRMRWAEGHSFNIKQMMGKLFASGKLTGAEKFELAYLAPFYLQAFFFIVGTLSWLISEAVFKVKLPFWSVVWGWSLVLTNMLSLPLVNIVGLFYEESERRDYLGIGSFIALCYLVAPFQAYAAVKGFLEDSEGPWFRTPKTGLTTDIFTRGRFYRLITGIFSNHGGVGSGQAAQLKRVSPAPHFAFSSCMRRVGVRPKNMRYLARLLTVILLVISMNISYLAAGVSLTSNQEYMNEGQKLSLSSGLVKPAFAQTSGGGGKGGLGVVQTDPQTKPENFYLEDPTSPGRFSKPYIFTDESSVSVGTQYRVRLKSASGYQEFVFTDDAAGVRLYENGNVNARVDTSEYYVERYRTTGKGSWVAVGNTAWTMKAFTESNRVVIYRLVDIQGAVAGVMAQEHVLGFDGKSYTRKISVRVVDAGFDKTKITGATDLGGAREYFNSYVSSNATWLAEAHRMSWDLTGINEVTTDATDVKLADGSAPLSREYGNLIIDWADFGQDIKLDEVASSKKAQVWFIPAGRAGDLTVDPTLSITTAAATITVTSNQTPSWKAVWDSGKGGTIDEFYTPSDSATNIAEDDTTNQREQNLFNIRLAVSAGTSDSTAVSDSSVALTLLEYTDVRIKIRVEGELEVDGNSTVNGWYRQDYTVYPDRIIGEGWVQWNNSTAATVFEHSFNFEPATFTNNGTATDVYLGDNDTAMAAFATGTTWRTATNVTYEAPGPVAVMQIDSSNTDISVWATQAPFQIAQDDEFYWENGASFDRFAWGGDSVSILVDEAVGFGSVMKITADNTSDGSEGRLYALDYWTPDDLTFTTGSAWDSVKGENGGFWADAYYPVFEDGFETGDTSVWPSKTDTGSNFNVNTTSKNTGANGAQVTVGATVAYVRDNSESNNFDRIRARFYLDPNSLTMTTGDTFTIMDDTSIAGSEDINIELSYDGASYEVRACLENDTGTNECTAFVNINDAYNLIEAEWGLIDTTGYVRLWVNGVFGAEDALVDAGTQAVGQIFWGNVVGRDAGTSGSIFLDDFKWSANASYLGGASFDLGDGAYAAAASSDQVDLDIDGNSVARYKPAFKVKNYRLATDPSSISLEGAGLVDGTDYNVAVKPFSSAYFAQDITWASTIGMDTAITSPDIGTGGAVAASSYTYGRSGKGAFCNTAAGRYMYFPISGNFNIAKGAAELWYLPNYSYGSGSTYDLLTETNSDFRFYYDGANADLHAKITQDGNGAVIDTILTTSALWAASEWVHLRVEWDDSAATADQLRIFVDGVEPSHSDDTVDFDSTQVTGLGANMGMGGTPAAAGCGGVIDEVRVYSDDATPTKLADGGDPADTDEYLNDDTNDFTFSLADDDASNRGEYLFFGSDEKFNGLNVDLATLGVGTSLDLSWEYWNYIEGTNDGSWTSLETVSGFSDGTSNFTADGVVSWNVTPDNWGHSSVNGSANMFFIRVHLEAGSYSTNPIEDDIVTDILLFQYLNNISSAAQTLIIVPEYALLFTPIVAGMVYLSRKKRKKRT